MLRQEKGLPMMTELLAHGNDRVVRAMSGALRNLAIDARNRDLLGETLFKYHYLQHCQDFTVLECLNHTCVVR